MLAGIDEFHVTHHVVRLPWQASLLIAAVMLLVLSMGAGILVWFFVRKRRPRKVS